MPGAVLQSNGVEYQRGRVGFHTSVHGWIGPLPSLPLDDELGITNSADAKNGPQTGSGEVSDTPTYKFKMIPTTRWTFCGLYHGGLPPPNNFPWGCFGMKSHN